VLIRQRLLEAVSSCMILTDRGAASQHVLQHILCVLSSASHSLAGRLLNAETLCIGSPSQCRRDGRHPHTPELALSSHTHPSQITTSQPRIILSVEQPLGEQTAPTCPRLSVWTLRKIVWTQLSRSSRLPLHSHVWA